MIRTIAIAMLALSASAALATPERREVSRVDLSGAPGMEVVTSITTYHKGDVVPSHFHNGIETAYVVQGTMIRRRGQPPTMDATGATPLNLRAVRHGDYAIVGDTPLILFTVHIVDKGKPVYDGVPAVLPPSP